VLVMAPQVLVARADLPASDLRAFIADAKARPGGLNVASPGPGTISHLTEVLLEQRTGIKTSHIPFRGAAPAVTALIGKHVDASWLMPAPLLSSIGNGQLKALAVTGAARDPKLPNVPTAEEAGLPDFQIMNWQGLFAVRHAEADRRQDRAGGGRGGAQARDSRPIRQGRFRRARRRPCRGGGAGAHQCRPLVRCHRARGHQARRRAVAA
jgi:tripartite-type tricarboxylate transporter receptor subunit TctC